MKKLSLSWSRELAVGFAFLGLLLISFLLANHSFVQARVFDGSCQEEKWVDTTDCVASECGTSNGTKEQARYHEVCDFSCPTVQFSASHRIYTEDKISYGSWGLWSSWGRNNYCSNNDESAGICEDQKSGNDYRRRYRTVNHVCPDGYTYEEQSGPNDCYKEETFGPIDVVYGEKSNDPNHCHKPTPESLNIPSWARGEYGKLVTELAKIKANCRQEVTETRTVACDNAPVIACEEEPYCGDGIKQDNEQCDDGNQTNGDGCSSECQNETSEPTPTSEATPTPTTTPGNNDSGRQSDYWLNYPSCENLSFEAHYRAKFDGSGVKDIEVKFSYRGKEETVKTNDQGEAYVKFDYSGAGEVKADANNDYPDQMITINDLVCDSGIGGGQVLGVNTYTPSQGQVLGASTDILAATGTFSTSVALAIRATLGFVLAYFGYNYFAKKNN